MGYSALNKWNSHSTSDILSVTSGTWASQVDLKDLKKKSEDKKVQVKSKRETQSLQVDFYARWLFILHLPRNK